MNVFEIILSAIISALLSLVFADQMKGFIFGVASTVGIFKTVNMTGVWRCTFDYNEKSYVEIISIKQFGNRIVGKIEYDHENYDAVKKVMDKHPLRLTGTVADSRYITGFWYHPIEQNRYHGAFQMILEPNVSHAEGKWVGMSKTANAIESGKWVFEKKQLKI